MERLGKFIFGLMLTLLFVFLVLSLYSYSPFDFPNTLTYTRSGSIENYCGYWGAVCTNLIFCAVGLAGYFVFFPAGISLIQFWRPNGMPHPILWSSGVLLMLFSLSGLCAFLLTQAPNCLPIGPGGYVGAMLCSFLDHYFARLGGYIFLAGLFVSGSILTGDIFLVLFLLRITGIEALGEIIFAFLKKHRQPKTRFSRTGNLPTRRSPSRPGFFSSFFQRSSGTPTLASLAKKSKNPQLKNESTKNVCPESVGTLNHAIDQGTPFQQSVKETISNVIPLNSPTFLEQQLTKVFEKNDTTSSLNSDLEIDEDSHPDFMESDSGTDWEMSQTNSETTTYQAGKGSLLPNSALLSKTPLPRRDYHLPPIDLLNERTEYDYSAIEDKLRARGELLEKAFKSYKMDIKVVDMQTGPVLTLYEIMLSEGLRVKNVRSLTTDLEVAMKVPSVRIVSPIPGKDTIGVELPNTERQLVRLREVIEESVQQSESMQIPIFLGKDVAGDPIVTDLSKLPHLLIAGRTGTGKSVCLNSIIMSILMTRTPEEVKMILIDPKMVELSPYKTIPHLMHPVVIDMKKAEAILEWAVEKMEQRYKFLARAGARQLKEYNALTPDQLRARMKIDDEEEWATIPKKMSYIVIIADEMADLMMTSGKEVERHIIRLAQKSRAVGIHLVLATQKPTVDVVTGLIKSNLPARIAFGVATRTDSQVVLDSKGAEQLLGNGDMLFLRPGTGQILRGQGTFVSDKEIDNVVASIGLDESEIVHEIELTDDEEFDNELVLPLKKDKYYDMAVETVFQQGKASISFIQRKFSVGYNRAAKMVECMEAEGIVTAADKYKPSKPRELLMTYQDWIEMKESIEQAKNFNDRSAEPRPNFKEADFVQSVMTPNLKRDSVRDSSPSYETRPSEMIEGRKEPVNVSKALDETDADEDSLETRGETTINMENVQWTEKVWDKYFQSWEDQQHSADPSELSFNMRDKAKERRVQRQKK